MTVWAENAVFYHIYPLGFCGAPEQNDFKAAPESRILKVLDWLEHLKILEINAVYFGPVFESTKHGYDTADYLQIDRRLGNKEDFKLVCNQLHEAGIRVILDGVFNHVGRDFWAFKDVLAWKDQSSYKDWFYLDFYGNSNYNDGFYYEGWEGHYDLVKLNLNNPDVKDYLFHAIDEWIEEYDIDGLRLDVAYCLEKEFLCSLHNHCKSKRQDFWLMGEALHGDYKTWMNDQMLDSITNYECYKGIYSSLNSKNMFEIAYSFNRQFGREDWSLYRGCHLYNFVDNHDVNRIASSLSNEQNLPLAYALLFTMPGIPSVYYGSEWGVKGEKTGGNDAALRPCIDLQPENALSRNISDLARVHKAFAPFTHGDYTQLYLTNEQFVFARELGKDQAVVALNCGERQIHISCGIPMREGFDLNGCPADLSAGIDLAPHSFKIFTNRKLEPSLNNHGESIPETIEDQKAGERISPEIKEYDIPAGLMEPQIHPDALVLQGAVVTGDVKIAKDCSVWYNAVLRGDLAPIILGMGSNVQECSILHVDMGLPLIIGESVTVGHGAILHSCEIGDNSLIGMGAIVLNGAKIGKNCIVGAGALVTQNSVIPDGSLVLGNPAKIKREVSGQEIESSRKNALEYVELLKRYRK